MTTYFSLSDGGPAYCKGFKNFLDKNLSTSYTQCPVSVGGQITIEGNGVQSTLPVACTQQHTTHINRKQL